MFKIRTILLFVEALTLMTVLATATYFKMTRPATSPSISAANAMPQSVALALGSVNPSATHSFYMSNQTIRRILDQAYEQHRWGPREHALLRILNGRYENRVGMPR